MECRWGGGVIAITHYAHQPNDGENVVEKVNAGGDGK